VQALLHQRLQMADGSELDWPKAISDACRNAAIGQAIWGMRHQHLLRQVLARLSTIGVRPVLFKGAALAYDFNPSPFPPTYLRP
jgi:hypothetical protein